MGEGSENEGGSVANARFCTTHWSVVLKAAEPSSPHGAEALSALCNSYWLPLYAYVRRLGHNPHDAEDLTQEFFARLVEKEWIGSADSTKGKFRSFLLTAMKRFLANDYRHSQAAKRNSGQPLVSLDDTAEVRYAQETVSTLSPEKLYDRRWALSLFERALRRLREQHAAPEKSRGFDQFKKYLSEEPGPGDYARLGSELGISRGAVAAAVHRLRQHYRELVREEISLTVETPAQVDEELRSLLVALE